MNISTVSYMELHLAKAVFLSFTTQKNGVENKVIKWASMVICVCAL